MAKAASKTTLTTTLVIGSVKVPVGLFSTRDKPGKVAEFTTAGPNGGVLKARSVARAVPVDDLPVETVDRPVRSDPLSDPDEVRKRLADEVKAEMPQAATDGPVLGPMLDEVAVEMAAIGALGERWSAEHATATEAASAGDPAAREAIAAGRMFDEEFEGLPAARWSEQPERMKQALEIRGQVDGEYGRELVEEGTGAVVLPQDVRRGVRLEDGRFIDCTEQLAEIDERTKLEAMTVVAFVDITKVPRVRVQAAQYVGAADEKAPRALRIIFEGLKRTRRGALVKLTKRSRQTLGVIAAVGNVLVLYELVWAEDFRPPPPRALRIQAEEVTDAEVERFCELIVAMGDSPAAIEEMRDDALELREVLHAKALAGEIEDVVIPPALAAEPSLMEQLEASLAAVGS